MTFSVKPEEASPLLRPPGPPSRSVGPLLTLPKARLSPPNREEASSGTATAFAPAPALAPIIPPAPAPLTAPLGSSGTPYLSAPTGPAVSPGTGTGTGHAVPPWYTTGPQSQPQQSLSSGGRPTPLLTLPAHLTSPHTQATQPHGGAAAAPRGTPLAQTRPRDAPRGNPLRGPTLREGEQSLDPQSLQGVSLQALEAHRGKTGSREGVPEVYPRHDSGRGSGGSGTLAVQERAGLCASVPSSHEPQGLALGSDPGGAGQLHRSLDRLADFEGHAGAPTSPPAYRGHAQGVGVGAAPTGPVPFPRSSTIGSGGSQTSPSLAGAGGAPEGGGVPGAGRGRGALAVGSGFASPESRSTSSGSGGAARQHTEGRLRRQSAQGTVPQCTALFCPALHCPALYCPALYCTALLCPALYCPALHFSSVRSPSAVCLPPRAPLGLILEGGPGTSYPYPVLMYSTHIQYSYTVHSTHIQCSYAKLIPV